MNSSHLTRNSTEQNTAPWHPILAALILVLGAAFAADALPLNIDATLEKIRSEHKLPALAGAVIFNSRIAAASAYGERRLGDKASVTPGDKFHLGSCSKAITGTLAAILVENKKLSWEITLETVFPELAWKMDPAFRKITLEQILAHRSGLAADTSGDSDAFKTEVEVNRLPGALAIRRLKLVEKVLTQKPAQPPGEKYVYANQNFVVAAAIIERAAGVQWEQLATTRIFKPLGMDSVGFGAMGTPNQGDQPLQHRVEADGTVKSIEPGPNADNPEIMTPAGRVHCSMGDWAKFILDHVVGESGGGKLLKAESYKRIHTAPFGGEYVAGWNVTTRPWAKGPVLAHSGTNNNNYCSVWMAPADGFAVMAATNQGGAAASKACDKFCSTMIIKLKPGK